MLCTCYSSNWVCASELLWHLQHINPLILKAMSLGLIKHPGDSVFSTILYVLIYSTIICFLLAIYFIYVILPTLLEQRLYICFIPFYSAMTTIIIVSHVHVTKCLWILIENTKSIIPLVKEKCGGLKKLPHANRRHIT